MVNAYVLPIVQQYVQSLQTAFARLGMGAPLLIMQSNGGVMTAEACRRQPVYIIESGPAAGVIASQALAKRMNLDNVITFDMGGTTAKASIIEEGALQIAAEYEVGSSLSSVSRLIKGGGHLIRIPAIDVAEVGAGGGSIAWLDAGGALNIGPRSAGSSPGPVCYDQGGTEATITDANLLLGYINPEGLVGGGLPLNRRKAEQALSEQIAAPLGLDLIQAAYGVHLLADATMIRAVRAVSTERGRDLREAVLFAFGGSGPIHACGMAGSLEMTRAVVPLHPGLFSAFGLLAADIEHHRVQTCYQDSRHRRPGTAQPTHGPHAGRGDPAPGGRGVLFQRHPDPAQGRPALFRPVLRAVPPRTRGSPGRRRHPPPGAGLRPGAPQDLWPSGPFGRVLYAGQPPPDRQGGPAGAARWGMRRPPPTAPPAPTAGPTSAPATAGWSARCWPGSI